MTEQTNCSTGSMVVKKATRGIKALPAERVGGNIPGQPLPKFGELMTMRKTKKLWINPENEILPLTSWHYEFFRDPEIAKKYGILFRDEENTRLDALRVGFVRINYELNGGRVTMETMRWDRTLRDLTTSLVLENAEAIDLAHIYLLNESGQTIQLGCVSFMDRRQYGMPINRRSIATWNNFRVTRLVNRKPPIDRAILAA